jgi:hypothetical protein
MEALEIAILTVGYRALMVAAGEDTALAKKLTRAVALMLEMVEQSGIHLGR